MATRLKGWKFAVFIGGFVTTIMVPFYFTAIQPTLDSSYYKQMREEAVPKLKRKS